ncbi:MAG: cytochrome c maturation protein CcmE [Thermincolia bacterium]
MNKKTKFIIVGIVLVALGLLFAQGFNATGGVGLYLTIEEALTNYQKDSDKFIQMEGTAVKSSIKYDRTKPELIFDLTDGKNNVVKVTFYDIMPDNLESGYPVIVEGRFTSPKEFVADKLKVKCPSRYEEENKQQ